MVSTSAKQRLWIRCLGYPVADHVDWQTVEQCFQHARQSGRYQQPITAEQSQLAASLRLSLDGCANAGEAAGQLYELLLAVGFVYSVYRQLANLKGDRYADTGLPWGPALAIAHQIRGSAIEFKEIATTGSYDGDVFFRMSKKAQKTAAYQHVARHFAAAAPPPRSPPTQTGPTGPPPLPAIRRLTSRRPRARRGPSPLLIACFGVAVAIVVAVLAGVALLAG